MKKFFFVSLTVVVSTFKLSAQTLYPKNDTHHTGETITVSDRVYGGKLLTIGHRTVLDLGGYAPNQMMTVMIPGEDIRKFKGLPHKHYKGKNITVTGKLVFYRGKPAIFVNDPSQVIELYTDNNVRGLAKQK